MKGVLPNNTVICGDVLKSMQTLPDNSIDTIISSPPYYQLRDYGYSEQWGLEKTYTEYLDKMISFMKECKRVIKDSGSIWINLGDSYNGSGNDSGKTEGEISQQISGRKVGIANNTNRNYTNTIPLKSLMLIPHRFAIRCVDELGLILRNDIIWAKPNGMPESVTDRFSKKHEFFFFFVKSKKYYFDLDGVREKPLEINGKRKVSQKMFGGEGNSKGVNMNRGFVFNNPSGKNPGDVADFWAITTKSSSEKHYATFNSELIDKPIVAGSPEGGTVLDPFAGTGTTLIRAMELGRNVIGIEAKKEYADICKKRIDKELIKIKLF